MTQFQEKLTALFLYIFTAILFTGLGYVIGYVKHSHPPIEKPVEKADKPIEKKRVNKTEAEIEHALTITTWPIIGGGYPKELSSKNEQEFVETVNWTLMWVTNRDAIGIVDKRLKILDKWFNESSTEVK